MNSCTRVAIQIIRLLLSKGPSFLVFWPEESAVSVVNACKITDPEPESLQLQQDCKVKVGRNIYSGKVAAIGKCYAIILCPLAYCTSMWEDTSSGYSISLLYL